MLDSKDIHKTDLFETLEKLKDLPREEPEGSEDIYGMDYQVSAFDSKLAVWNGFSLKMKR